MLKRLIPCLAVVALLSACATTEPSSAAKSHAALADALASANAAAKADHNDKAIGILQDAAKAHPVDKTPWIRMAQMRYDAGDYGQAIVLAQQGLQRDADDMVAHSIVAVAGLRVASKALADLTRRHNLSGTIRSEAQDLAKLLRASLGEEILVPGAPKGRSATVAPQRKPPQTPVAASSAQKKASSDDPFEALK